VNHTLCFVAGKSGGHIIPCTTLAARAKALDPELKILFFSTNSNLDQAILQTGNNKQLINTHVALPLSGATVSLKKLYRVPKIAWQFFRSFCTSFSYLRKYRPQEVVSTGGYIAIPVIIAARILRIPVTLYELNVQPGKAVYWLAPHVNKICICFSKTVELLNTGSRHRSGSCSRLFTRLWARSPFSVTKVSGCALNDDGQAMSGKPAAVSCELVEYPVRFNRLPGDIDMRAENKINKAKKTIFIIGGSQGSRFLNQAVIQALTNIPGASSDFAKLGFALECFPPRLRQGFAGRARHSFTRRLGLSPLTLTIALPPLVPSASRSERIEGAESLHIIHQTGAADVELVQQAYQELGIAAQVFSYSDQIEEYYKSADLVISRAGAGGLFETLFFKKPCIIIPLEMAHDSHQLANAREMVLTHPKFFVLLRQGDLTKDPELLAHTIQQMLE
jgi:UDP-N-acetylglucosamine:LPS N-acetylglucosamine transferase